MWHKIVTGEKRYVDELSDAKMLGGVQAPSRLDINKCRDFLDDAGKGDEFRRTSVKPLCPKRRKSEIPLVTRAFVGWDCAISSVSFAFECSEFFSLIIASLQQSCLMSNRLRPTLSLTYRYCDACFVVSSKLSLALCN